MQYAPKGDLHHVPNAIYLDIKTKEDKERYLLRNINLGDDKATINCLGVFAF